MSHRGLKFIKSKSKIHGVKMMVREFFHVRMKNYPCPPVFLEPAHCHISHTFPRCTAILSR